MVESGDIYVLQELSKFQVMMKRLGGGIIYTSALARSFRLKAYLSHASFRRPTIQGNVLVAAPQQLKVSRNMTPSQMRRNM